MKDTEHTILLVAQLLKKGSQRFLNAFGRESNMSADLSLNSWIVDESSEQRSYDCDGDRVSQVAVRCIEVEREASAVENGALSDQ